MKDYAAEIQNTLEEQKLREQKRTRQLSRKFHSPTIGISLTAINFIEKMGYSSGSFEDDFYEGAREYFEGVAKEEIFGNEENRAREVRDATAWYLQQIITRSESKKNIIPQHARLMARKIFLVGAKVSADTENTEYNSTQINQLASQILSGENSEELPHSLENFVSNPPRPTLP